QPVAVADDHVAGLHGGAAAGDRLVDAPRHVTATEYGGVRVREPRRQADGGDGVGVAQAAVGHDARRPALLRAEGEYVAEGARAGLAAGVHHDHLARSDVVEEALLRVV